MNNSSILVVDDNHINLKLTRKVLSSEGYDVITALDAEEGLEVLKRVTPAIILMDLQLPGMDGFELARRLKADPATRDIHIMAVTAYAMKGDDRRALEAGCDAYLSKPVDIDVRVERVSAILKPSPAP
jgi:CheY-like chemotaxis protein